MRTFEINNTTVLIDKANVCPHVDALNILEGIGGLIAYWAINAPHDAPMRDYVNERYCAPLVTCEIPGNAFIDSRGYFCYETDDDEPNDEPLPPMIEIRRADESLVIFQYSICAFISGNDKPYFVRLD